VNDAEKYLGRPVDIILVNNEEPSPSQLEQYKTQEGEGVLVEDDLEDIRLIREPLLSNTLVTYSKADKIANLRSFIRHDSEKLANCIQKIISN
jgi:hypothetical protein